MSKSRRSRSRRAPASKPVTVAEESAATPPVPGIKILGISLFALLTICALLIVNHAVAQNGTGPAPTPAAIRQAGTPTVSPSPAATQPAGAKEGATTASVPTPPKTTRDWNVVGGSIGIIALLTILNGVFSMAETALTSVRRSRVEQMVEEKRSGADAVKKLQDDPPRYIATVQAGITLLGFAASASAAIAIAPALQTPITMLSLSPRIANNVAVAIVVIFVAIITLVFGEIAPKAIAMQSPDVWALRLAPFVRFCSVLFAPLNAVVLGISNVLVSPFGAKARFETPMISREEFGAIIESGTEKGEFDREEQAIIENVIDFSETLVRAVMTPRIDLTAVPADADLLTTMQTVIASGHSRLPVFENTSDTIVGIVHAKDLLQLFADGQVPGTFTLHDVMRAPVFVPESRRVADLLAEMRRSKNQIAVVQDEYGGTAGIVSLEDLLEEIVGDIRDEYDIDEPEIKVLNADESLIDGRMSIADVNDRLGIELSDDEYTTVGGLVFGLLGHEPVMGEKVHHEGFCFVVDAMEKGRIKTVRAVRLHNGETPTRETETVGAVKD